MGSTKDEGAHDQGDDDPNAFVAGKVGEAVEKVTAEEHLLDEGSFRPGDDEEEQQGGQAAFQEAELGQVDRFTRQGLKDWRDSKVSRTW